MNMNACFKMPDFILTTWLANQTSLHQLHFTLSSILKKMRKNSSLSIHVQLSEAGEVAKLEAKINL